MVAVFATTAIFSYWSTFVGGELRQASTMKTARNMALGGIIPLIVVATLHGDLLPRRSAASSFAPRTAVACRPRSQVPGTTFFYLSGISVGSAAYTFVIFLLYIVFWPLITYISSLQQTRAIFAMSFDGVLPKGVTRVNRYGCPWLALLIALLVSSVVFIYAVWDQTGFFIVLAYALLVQLIAMGLVGLVGCPRTEAAAGALPGLDLAEDGRRHPARLDRRARRHRHGRLRLVGVSPLRPARSQREHGQAAGVDGRACRARLRPLLRRGGCIKRGQGVDVELAYREIPPE